MSVKFRTIIPKVLNERVFDNAWKTAARNMERDVKGAFQDATKDWKHQPEWRGYVRIDGNGAYISVSTNDLIFKFVDEGTEPHIIKPVNAKVLHWEDPLTGEDRFATLVHHPGYKGAKISESIVEIWNGLMPIYFDDELRKAIQESGHALK